MAKPLITYKYQGKLRTIKQLAKIAGINRSTLRHRLKVLPTVEEALKPSVKVTYEYKGSRYTVAGLAKLTGLVHATISSRISRGLSIEEAVRPLPPKTIPTCASVTADLNKVNAGVSIKTFATTRYRCNSK
jgi:uncharacterized protein YidB (DUF937 family)